MPQRKHNAQLLVEGKDDQHTVWALCGIHRVAETFSVEIPDSDNGGIDELMKGIPVRLKISRLRALGIVVDADDNLQGRWDAICNQLKAGGYANIPTIPDENGYVSAGDKLPRVGVWVMPNNTLPGMLENFLAYLIPANDNLAPKINQFIQDIEREKLHRYAQNHQPKAFMHMWLACQENPGRPFGQAITARVLEYNKPLALAFVNWLDRLFNLDTL